ncbi:MAG: GTP pyrophosphokinase family protein [Lachnospiraceae bacterium]|jgi:putative GTP pyrophosphokinase|nr:GTP pyrophosphokinase family protein [Lachnospiraceae bacterium]MEE3460863.1 GTP pyrophosphokinase family protein [Lachnospiraceae bacterium]
MSIYGTYEGTLEYVSKNLVYRLEQYNTIYEKEHGARLFEHLSSRIKSDASMREKCRRKGFPENEYSALHDMHDSIGIRIVCSFVNDIFKNVEKIKEFPDVVVVKEKDYVRHAKPNGYRSYHMILSVEVPYPDVLGMTPGHYFVEVQLRTIAMDSWAALEHQMKYKKTLENQDLIVSELKRVADELASCDISMQTIHELINS